ncbi:MAG: DUF4338 domain-containing protein [Anaerolineae bacterium]|nr:DUF4338 domain-containing protein [Anaerolineae bacterium]
MNYDKKKVRRKIIKNLKDYGVLWNKKENKLVVSDFRTMQGKLAVQTNLLGRGHKVKVEKYIATRDEIDILKVFPYLVEVNSSTEHARLWSYATSFWSVPVTTGYGRRLRFFVFDRQNEKLIGIIGLCDPVIGLETRDKHSIGWTKEQKLDRLYNCMTAYILGAVPPYNLILGSKLVALTLMFPKIRDTFRKKYSQTTPLISKKKKKPYLVYIDTLGAFGKSAIYNRLFNWKFIGYTKGQSHIHITANGSWELIKKVVAKKKFKTYKYGQGPNWKMRILREGLRILDLPMDIMSIGWQRGYYRCVLADNWKPFLLGEEKRVKWKIFDETQLVEYWREKWVVPRITKLQDNLLNIQTAEDS